MNVLPVIVTVIFLVTSSPDLYSEPCVSMGGRQDVPFIHRDGRTILVKLQIPAKGYEHQRGHYVPSDSPKAPPTASLGLEFTRSTNHFDGGERDCESRDIPSGGTPAHYSHLVWHKGSQDGKIK